MKIITYTKDSNVPFIHREICKTLKGGGLVVSPSDTVYGLLADATNKKAVEKLIAFKNRPPGKPISVFISDFTMLSKTVKVENSQRRMLEELLPGPYTMVLSSLHSVSSLLESEKSTLGVRYPDYPFLTGLVKQFGNPITATSANLSSDIPHYSIDTLLRSLSKAKQNLIDLIVDAGHLPRNKPSTLIDLAGSHIKILRKGDMVPGKEKHYISKSPYETMHIAKQILHEGIPVANTKPVVFILKGNLGVGKTVFVKGIAETFGVFDIISPSYVVYYEYNLQNQLFTTFVHGDFYAIEDPEEFLHLGLETYLDKKNILCFEWGEKGSSIIEMLKKKSHVIFVEMEYMSKTERSIYVNFGH